METTLYVWTDVAVVHVLCAVPLAMLLGGLLATRLSRAVLLVIAGLLLGGVVLALTGAGALATYPLLGVVARAVVALGIAGSAVLAWVAMTGRRAGPRQTRSSIAAGSFALILLFVVPSVYLDARAQHDLARLGELLDQARLGEAQLLAGRLGAQNPGAKWRGGTISEVAEHINRAVRELESAVAVPLHPGAADRERLERARLLAMLGRPAEALEVFAFINGPDADILRGTIHETLGSWQTALDFRERAYKFWLPRPDSEERTAGLVRAVSGIAYCQRKLGRYADAEATYQELLALSPTADTHFLLAQFYEDAQHAEKARTHARQAMAMAPARYQAAGEELIRKLTVFHFGCLGVFSAERYGGGTP